jgi:ribonuclease III
MIDTQQLKDLFGVEIQDKKLFETAFTHRSYLNEHPGHKSPSNERLEFLGDAVLQLLSSEYLYELYPDKPEGDLTNYRSAVVCTESLAKEAHRLGYGKHLFLSHGEEVTGGRDREYILANTFESVLGALYLENGLDFCQEFVIKELFHKIEDIVKNEAYKDSKSKFQEMAQEKKNVTPRYEVVNSWGLDHEKTFRIAVFLEEEKWGEGEGQSKQKAEQQAAQYALEKLEKE